MSRRAVSSPFVINDRPIQTNRIVMFYQLPPRVSSIFCFCFRGKVVIFKQIAFELVRFRGAFSRTEKVRNGQLLRTLYHVAVFLTENQRRMVKCGACQMQRQNVIMKEKAPSGNRFPSMSLILVLIHLATPTAAAAVTIVIEYLYAAY